MLRACAESVTFVSEPNLAESASRLSDVAFRTCLADREGPFDLVARGLAALWFERDLTRVAGALPHELEGGETALAAVARRRTDPRAEANASAVMVRVLLEAGTLHERCVKEARRTVSLWPGVSRTSTSRPRRGPTPQHMTCSGSATPRAISGWPRPGTGTGGWPRMRGNCRAGLPTAGSATTSRGSRAEGSLAALAAEAGRWPHATKLITSVLATRLALRERQPQDPASWRRLTVTQRTRTDIARLNGQVIEGVQLAADLLADRQARLGELGQADTAEARIVLGQTLLAAGHPLAARRHLEEAADTRRARFLPSSYRVQEDLIWLAKAALVLEHPRTVLDLLDGQTAGTDWFRDRVSFRLGYTARRLLALASGELGQTDEAVTALRACREQLADWPLAEGLDPLAADFDRSLGELALLQGEAAGAVTSLTQLTTAEAAAGLPSPAHGWTLVLLGRAADRLGDTRRAAESFRSVTELASAGIDPCHPVILTARYDEPARCAARGDASRAAKLLAPVLDRTLLSHGWPALGEGHPLLSRARALAERLGVAGPYTPAGLDEASLDIDV